jgi:recombination protein RecT
MAFKTMLRQLISKWGIMSIEMREAFENDGEARGSGAEAGADFFSEDSGSFSAAEPSAAKEPKRVSLSDI